MKTREQCLEKAMYCERLARDSSLPSNKDLLLEAAAHWRGLAASLPPEQNTAMDNTAPVSTSDDEMLAAMLAGVGVLAR